MKPPIFAFEPNDVDVFKSVADAELTIEPIDARNASFVYFDAEGQRLTAVVVTDEHGVERTTIREMPERSFDPEKLREILINYLAAVGESNFDLASLSLEELVGRSLEFTAQ